MYGQKLITWYEVNKRNLPWRDTSNPYCIWVSEIILQQTRVNQGISYYYRFIDTFPNVSTLAEADIDDVLKLWQGLGYYSRARNMHVAAKDILTRYKGKFPSQYDDLVSIKGIGDYTASAIASIAFNQPVPVIDGNVNRVIARLYNIADPVNKTTGMKLIRTYAEEMLVKSSPGIYNQAIMEFGALHCVPHNPDCEMCVLKAFCLSYQKGMVNNLPVKENNTKVKTRYFNYLVIKHKESTYIRRRSDGDIWSGLYEFPLIETDAAKELEELYNLDIWRSLLGEQEIIIQDISQEIVHRLTHRILKIRFYDIRINNPAGLSDWIEIPWQHIHRYAVPKVIENYLKDKIK